jgi:hypothetical protein
MNATPSFRPVPCHGGWQILVTWSDARTEQLIGYSSEAEAVKWINNLSDRWADKALAAKKDRRRTFNGRAFLQLIAIRLTAFYSQHISRSRSAS